MKKVISFLVFSTFFANLWGLVLPIPVQAQTGSDAQTFKTGVDAYKDGRYQEAVDALSRIIASDPSSLDAFRVRGSSYMKLEKYAAAVADFEKAVELAPDKDGVYSDLGTAWYYSKNYQKALENYDREIEKGHQNHLVFFNRALCLEQIGHIDRALADINTSLAINPKFYWALCYKGNLLAQKKEYTKAAKAYKEAIDIDNNNSYAKERLARIKDKPSKKNQAESKSIRHEQTAAEKEAATTSAWSVQTGAFRVEPNAVKMLNDLIQKGFDTKILTLEDSKGNVWYLVRSGSYPDKKTAEKTILKFKALGIKALIRPAGAW